MERAVVIGNCQAKALELLLATNEAFAARFAFDSFPAVHEIPDEQVPELHRAVAAARVVIPQRVTEEYRDGIGLGTETLARIAGDATVVRWPSVYWGGYVPDLFYLRDAAGAPVVDGPFDYHDRVILQAYADGLDVAATCRLLEDPDRPSDARALADTAIAELEVRGAGCDVQVTATIAEHYRDDLLFFTMNHPSNRLLADLSDQILRHLGLPGSVDLRFYADELLGSTFYPLHANHVRALGLTFGDRWAAGRTPFRIRGAEHDAPTAVGLFFDYYAANPQLVEINVPSRAG